MTETLTYRLLRRSRSDRMVAGVSGGLGRYFDVNPVLYRVGFVVLALLGGAGILIYAAAALVIPDEGRDESIVEQALRERRRRPWQLIGLGLVAVSSVVLLSQLHFWDARFGWLLVLVSGIVLLLLGPRLWNEVTIAPPALPPARRPDRTRRRRRPHRRRPASPARIVVPAAQRRARPARDRRPPFSRSPPRAAWTSRGRSPLAVAAGAVGVAVIVGALLHMRVRGLVVVGIVLGAAAILASTIDLRLDDGIGDRHYAPTTAAGLQDDYRLGIGELNLDFGDLALPPGKTTRHGLARRRAHAGDRAARRRGERGQPRRLGRQRDPGPRARTAATSTTTSTGKARPGAPLLVLDADVGAGQIEVVRAVR